ncbi:MULTISPECIES: succinylglutamate desuccinylase/aspartoacylase family protein [Halorussus]|uniref:succinylglutamate desuccinylase/aspartoacylase family protein n=1 Tax=Halorussus TaxID=1070314 RepID=UPI00209CA747|nr:succinylglutamate desuccinylase/aspartoacylase family protein [Halorussus vallis]USZ77021.1 succinylglutamate desuccinylase/aspartoacylase family protein [Halorussus vallis]
MEHDSERVALARLPSGVEVSTTVHTYRGRDGDGGSGDGKGGDDPTVYVQAAQHGREINGTEVLRRIHERFTDEDPALSGTVVTVPVADPLTFDRVSYTTPEQLDSVNPNMNRVWPGDAEGTLHERMAARLWEYAGAADAVVDLHTGSPDMLPHVVFTEGHAESRALAEAFGTDLLLSEPMGEDADAEWADRAFDGKLRVTAAREDIPTITPELAHNKQFVESAVETGVTGVLNVLRHLGALADDPEPNGTPTLARNHLGRVTTDDAGLFRADPDRAVGQRVEAGDRLGTVYDPTTFETLQIVEADRDGILYALTREATVTGGEKLANVALERDE